jgi:hypothetical protein
METFVEQGTVEPVPLSEADLNRIARRVAESFGDRDLDRLAKQVKDSFTEKEWEGFTEKLAEKINIVEHGEAIGKRLLGAALVNRKFLLVAAIAIGSVYLLIKEWGGHVAAETATTLFNQEMTNEINLRFQEPGISNVVVSVASSETTNLMLHQIQPTIAAFEDALNSKLASLQTNLDTIQADAKSNVTALQMAVEFSTLVARAQCDEREALWKLIEIANSTNNPYSKLADVAPHQLCGR